MTTPRAEMKQHFLHNCLVAGVTMLAATQGLRAQDITIVPCNGDTVADMYCYVNNDEHVWHWQSECGSPIQLSFTSGIIESGMYDQLLIFDGPDDLSVVIYLNGSDTGNVDLTGLNFTASSGDLYMRLISDPTNCCADGLRDMATEWVWSLSSGSVGINEEPPEAFTMYPNPATSELHMRLPGGTHGPAETRILDVTGRVVYQNNFVATGAGLNTVDLYDLQIGNYSVVLTTANGVRVQKLEVVH
ncbi:MAG: T9SS type A sorting domain-containing protein [Flavobacteriales bacterium]